MKNKLYKLTTKGFGDYWVVAKHPTQAEEKLYKFFDDADIKMASDRNVVNIKLIAIEHDDIRFITGYNLLT